MPPQTPPSDETGPLLSLTSHELKTPLSVVIGYVRMLLGERPGPLGAEQRRMLEAIDRSCERLTELTREIGQLGRLRSKRVTFNRRRVPATTLLDEAAARGNTGVARGVRIDVRGDLDHAVALHVDPDWLTPALASLVAAVAREVGDHRAVLLERRVEDRPTGLQLSIGLSDADAGGGLLDAPPDRLAALDTGRGGLGLRLPVARHVIEAEGGSVWTSTDPQRADALLVTLPAAR